MFRRFLLMIILFLMIVVIVVDRVGAIAGAHVLAGKVQTDEHLQNRPSATIKGIPFLTQAIGGKYSDIHLSDHELLVNEVPVTTLTVELHGVHLPFSKIVGGSVSEVPVDRVTGTAFVSYDDANDYLAHHLPTGVSVRLTSAADRRSVSMVDRVHLDGQRIVLRGSGTPTVSGNTVSVGTSGLTPAGSGVPASLLDQAVAKVAVTFPLQALPFKLQLTSVAVSSSGLTGTGTSDHIVLGSDG